MLKKKLVAMMTAVFLMFSTIPVFAKPVGLYLKNKNNPNEVVYIAYEDYMKAHASRNKEFREILEGFEIAGVSVKNDKSDKVIDYNQYVEDYKSGKIKNMDAYADEGDSKTYSNPDKVKELNKDGSIGKEIDAPDKTKDPEEKEVITIAEARKKDKDSKVTVKGVVTSRIGNNAFIEDKNAGIYIYVGGTENTNLKVGNSVSVTGVIGEFKGLKQIKDDGGEKLKVEVLKENQKLPTPETVKISGLDETLQGKRVTLEKVKVRGIGNPDKHGSYNVTITDEKNDVDIRVDGNLNPKIDTSSFKVGSTLNVTASVGRYNTVNQLMLSKIEDIKIIDEGDGETPKAPEKKIREIQGADHRSPLEGQAVSTEGIVTAISEDSFQKGFFMQDPNPDDDPATSEGIFVKFSSKTQTIKVGDLVKVEGTVKEIINGLNTDKTGLTETRIESTKVEVKSSGNQLPEAIVINLQGDLLKNIDNDGLKTFDINEDAIDYFESLEGMLVKIVNPLIVGADERYGEIYVVPNNGVGSEHQLTPRGGIKALKDDFNPEIITIDDIMIPITDSKSKKYIDKDMKIAVGDKFAEDNLIGIMSYGFGKFKFLNTEKLPAIVHGTTEREKTEIKYEENKLNIASYNIENFNPTEPDKVAKIANSIVNDLSCPDIMGLIEVQDSDGEKDTGNADASGSYQALVDAIKGINGVEYGFTDVTPQNNTDGGAPGGNIRQGFIYRKDRVSLVEKTKGEANVAVKIGKDGLSVNPGRIDPTNEVFKNSRKPLIGEFEFKGEKIFVIANHLNSKRGDEGLFSQNQPPVMGSESQRHKQAEVINRFIKEIKKEIPEANIVALGDMNDYEFSGSLQILKGSEMINMIEELPENKRYTYVYGGNSQVLDHILISNNLLKKDNERERALVDVVHINSEFTEGYGRVSDHDPVLVQLDLGIKDFTDEKAMVAAKDKLDLGNISAVESDLLLPTNLINGVTATWQSRDEDIISNEGKVTIPRESKEVILTANLVKGTLKVTKEFKVTVVGQGDILKSTKEKLDLGSLTAVVDNIKLPVSLDKGVTVNWTSNAKTVISNDGTVTRPEIGKGNATVTLTATLKLGELSETKDFDVTVLEKVKEPEVILKIANINDLTESFGKVELEDAKTYIKMIKPMSSLITSEMNFTEYAKKTLNFKARTFGGLKENSAEITISVSTDGGTNWDIVRKVTPANAVMTSQDEIDLSNYSGTNVKVKFETLLAVDGKMGAGIQDIKITGN
ncbi:hypothetical protein KQI89_12085 [Clostridium sp. MSJ-4]|uniref:Endonuclease/exonuclease/phosphatase n=1 Tax=Clostridium simiarum TaxID=2841506 RepID=A0ABS6F3P9_9CLOT|nr:immunoglobulin-like domain-containing protein [Clostridium simiarum]MBU5592494.1 hypothetical protein [Clostridium simiarum]